MKQASLQSAVQKISHITQLWKRKFIAFPPEIHQWKKYLAAATSMKVKIHLKKIVVKSFSYSLSSTNLLNWSSTPLSQCHIFQSYDARQEKSAPCRMMRDLSDLKRSRPGFLLHRDEAFFCFLI